MKTAIILLLTANYISSSSSTGLEAALGQYELFTDQNARDHLAWTIGNGDPKHEVCIPSSIPRAWEQQG